MADQTQRLEIATVRAEVGSNIVFRFSNDAANADSIPTQSGDIQNLKQVVLEIQQDAAEKISISTTIYPTVAAGLAATADQGIFLVQSNDADEIYTVWQNQSGTAVNTGKTALSATAIEEALEESNEAARAAEEAADIATNRTAGFLAPSATPPYVRDNGLPLQLGDRYFNTENQTEYIYREAGWKANDSLQAIEELESLITDSPKPEGIPKADLDGTIDPAWVGGIYETYAQMRASTKRYPQVAIRKPGFCGVFEYVGAVSGYTDNGGTVIITSGGDVYVRQFTGMYDSRWWGVVESLMVNSTDALQAAINSVHDLGGGDLFVPKNVIASQTKETGPTVQIKADGSYTLEPLTTQGCIILKSGVTLVGEGPNVTTIINPSSPNRITVVLYDMQKGGGLRNIGVQGGKGVQTQASSLDVWMRDMVLDYFRIFDTTSYGLGMQIGLYLNNRISNFHIYNTAQDALDHKARPNGNLYPIGITIENGICEKYGQTSGTESAGLDIRGLVHINNVVCRDFYVLGKNNRGIRFSTGVFKVSDHRVGADKSSITNFYINSGNAAGIGSVGLDIMEGSSISAVSGIIENCPIGFTTSDTVTGNGTGEGIKLIGVEVKAARSTAFKAASPNVTFMACKATQAEERFVSNLGNLVAGQTTLVTSQAFDPSTVRIYKNNVLMTSGYTLTGSTQVNLSAPADATDSFLVATPIPVGFLFTDGAERSGTNGVLMGNTTKGVTAPLQVADSCAPTLTRGSNNFEGSVGYRESVDGSYLEPYGQAADIIAEIRAKGAADVVLRSRNSRSIVATNPLGAVNWIEFRGSAAGDMPRISPQGSDSNLHLLLQGKGSTGTVAIIARNYSSDSAAASAGVPVNGIYHTAGTLKIRLT